LDRHSMKFSDWTHDLFKLAAAPHPLAVALRVGVAVGVPLLGGLATGNVPAGVIAAACRVARDLSGYWNDARDPSGHYGCRRARHPRRRHSGAVFGDSTYADEALVLLSAFTAGWVSASHPGIAAVARFCAVATAVGAGTQFTNPEIVWAALAGATIAIGSSFLTWWLFGVPA
jgi:hypothetical protein